MDSSNVMLVPVIRTSRRCVPVLLVAVMYRGCYQCYKYLGHWFVHVLSPSCSSYIVDNHYARLEDQDVTEIINTKN